MKKLNLIASLILISTIIFFGCKKDDNDSDLPKSSFEIVEQTKNKIVFKNNSSSYDKVIWEFGDGTITNLNKSEESTAIAHTYTEIGTYTVKLTVQSSEGSNSSSKSVTISDMAAVTAAEITNLTNISSTKVQMNYTLTAGPFDNHAKFYFQISLTSDFSVLEDADHWTTGHQDEVELGTTLTYKEIQNLIPEEKYYIRVKIKTSNPDSGDEVAYSDVSDFTSLVLPEPILTAEVGSSPFEFKISKSLNLDDIYPVINYEITTARDADFTEMVTLERRVSFDTYYREAGTNLFIKVTATVNGKSSEKTIQYNTPENYITGDDNFNTSGTFASLSENNTVLTFGTDGGERIEYHFLQPVTEGSSFSIENGNDPTKNRAIYYNPTGTLYECNNSSGDTKIYFYEITNGHTYVRLGSETDTGTGLFPRFSDPNSSDNIYVSGFIIKASID